jgi:hypothetical protein
MGQEEWLALEAIYLSEKPGRLDLAITAHLHIDVLEVATFVY